MHNMEFSSNNIIAYFQPILSKGKKSAYSYEVLGRFIEKDGTIKSLGSFFSDKKTTHDDALRIDRMVRRYAMKKYVEEKRNEYLFINIRLAWLDNYLNNPEELPTLKWAKELGIDFNRIVIEITEEEFNIDDSHVNITNYYKKVGCRIALDDYGKNASNIDRIAILKPDIIKINIDYIHKSEKHHVYREYLKYFSSFAESVGIDVLYEGIETQQQFDFCTSLMGKYYQGYFIAYPQASMNNTVINQKIFFNNGQ